MSLCKFRKYYQEPNEKYICLSGCLFYKESYKKYSLKEGIKNVSKQKIELFKKHLSYLLDNLLNKEYPSNYYLRLYVDKSILKVNEYKKLLLKMKNHPKVQLIEYECSHVKKDRYTHINLFGTLTRFYTLFDVESRNMDYCIFIDLDNYITKEYLQMVDENMKKGKLIVAVNKITQLSFYQNDSMYNDMNDIFGNVHFIASITAIKRDPIFSIEIWNRYFDNMYDQDDLMYIYNYLDFKKSAFYYILENENVNKKNKELITSYHTYYYGTDEIWLNYVLKKILKDNGKKDKLEVYYTQDYDFDILGVKLKEMLDYNVVVNKEGLRYFLYEYMKKKNRISNQNRRNTEMNNHMISTYMERNSNTYNINLNMTDEEIIQYVNEIKRDIHQIMGMNDRNRNKNIKYIEFMKNFSKNKYVNRIYIQSKIRFIMKNVEKLLKMRKKYKYNDLIKYKNKK